jgi:hypothetical protein
VGFAADRAASARIFLAVEKHAHVVFGGGNDERPNIHVGLQECRQHRRGTEAFRQDVLIFAFAHGGLIRRAGSRKVHTAGCICLRLPIQRQLGGTIGYHSRAVAHARYQNGNQVFCRHRTANRRLPSRRDLNRERSVRAFG